jgi:drug/metabolite transporter (DMT)-like permease
MKQSTTLNIEIFFALLLFSSNGIFVKLLSLGPILIVAYRSVIACIILGLYLSITKKFQKMSTKEILLNSLFGILLTAHWITFFYAFKVSTVAIATASLFTFPVFTAILEPIINKKSIKRKDIFLSLLVLSGITIMVPEWNIENTGMQGLLWGLTSSIVYVFRNIGLKKHLSHINSSQVMFGQTSIASIMLLPVIFQSNFVFEGIDIPLLLTIGIGVSAFGHTIFAKSIQILSAKTASVIFSSQVFISVLIAFFVIHEIPNWQTIIGGILILAAVYIEIMQTKS